MGNVSKLVPSIHPMIAHRAAARRAAHRGVRRAGRPRPDGDRGVVDGAKALALTGVDILCSPPLLQAMRAAFDAERGTPTA